MFSLTRAGHLEPLRRAFTLSPSLCRLHSTIFDKKVSAHHRDLKLAEETHVRTLLSYLLRPFSGREHGLPVRDDGSLSVRALLNHPQFASMSFLQLEHCISSDFKHRFELAYDPKRPDDPWWIRAKLWNEKTMVLRPVLASDTFNLPVVYTTTLAAWKDHIVGRGIPCGHEDYIHLTLGLPATNFVAPPSTTSSPSSPVVFIHVHPIAALTESNIHFFLVGPKPQDPQSIRTIYTKGDENGVIPPRYFGKVEVVRVQQRLLAGNWYNPTPNSPGDGQKNSTESMYPVPDPHVDPSTGVRRTFARLPDRNIRGFVNNIVSLNGSRQLESPHILAQQQKEAMQVALGAA
ncbi:hypothetical protein CVT24_004531 [Panaeolus cyanescens]|uniref:2'-phosphotransferase n=1 Tax=Panaeolus cyanescens TaxID=181874 RepID=A0A409YBV1_9AGAR|nr:hypothetical protein CVT24_004531 [Panaeolus cyanescens]